MSDTVKNTNVHSTLSAEDEAAASLMANLAGFKRDRDDFDRHEAAAATTTPSSNPSIGIANNSELQLNKRPREDLDGATSLPLASEEQSPHQVSHLDHIFDIPEPVDVFADQRQAVADPLNPHAGVDTADPIPVIETHSVEASVSPIVLNEVSQGLNSSQPKELTESKPVVNVTPAPVASFTQTLAVPSAGAAAALATAAASANKNCNGELRPAPFFYYKDYSTKEDSDPLTPLTAPGRVPNFPAKMHAILSRSDLVDIVCWMDHGRSWKVLKPREFEVRVIPTYFEHAKFSSFIRQANGWGFRRITTGKDRNSYYHPMFLRSLPHLCKDMKRPGVSKKLAADPDHEPDFYKISVEHPVPKKNPDDSIMLQCTLQGGPKARMPIYSGVLPTGASVASSAPVTMVPGHQNVMSSFHQTLGASEAHIKGTSSALSNVMMPMMMPPNMAAAFAPQQIPSNEKVAASPMAPQQLPGSVATPGGTSQTLATANQLALNPMTAHLQAQSQFAAGFAAAAALSQQQFQSMMAANFCQQQQQFMQQMSQFQMPGVVAAVPSPPNGQLAPTVPATKGTN